LSYTSEMVLVGGSRLTRCVPEIWTAWPGEWNYPIETIQYLAIQPGSCRSPIPDLGGPHRNRSRLPNQQNGGREGNCIPVSQIAILYINYRLRPFGLRVDRNPPPPSRSWPGPLWVQLMTPIPASWVTGAADRGA